MPVFTTTLAVPGRCGEALDEHDAIIVAIEERNAERAHDLAREHMTKARNLRLQIYRDELAG